jgi:hypothetical protein
MTVDPRIELPPTVQMLSDYFGYGDRPILTTLEFGYKMETAGLHSRNRDHPAVQAFKKVGAKGFWYGHPPSAMLSLSDPPEVRRQ